MPLKISSTGVASLAIAPEDVLRVKQALPPLEERVSTDLLKIIEIAEAGNVASADSLSAGITPSTSEPRKAR